jgi:hypothetical protein
MVAAAVIGSAVVGGVMSSKASGDAADTAARSIGASIRCVHRRAAPAVRP